MGFKKVNMVDKAPSQHYIDTSSLVLYPFDFCQEDNV